MSGENSQGWITEEAFSRHGGRFERTHGVVFSMRAHGTVFLAAARSLGLTFFTVSPGARQVRQRNEVKMNQLSLAERHES